MDDRRAAARSREIADLAHARGARVVVDGAQAVGAIPVSVADLGVDFYAIPGQKWLLGPEGTGALVVRSGDRSPRATPSNASWFTFERLTADRGASRGPTPGASTTSGHYRPGVTGLARSCGWLSMYVGLPWIHERGQAMARARRRPAGRRSPASSC